MFSCCRFEKELEVQGLFAKQENVTSTVKERKRTGEEGEREKQVEQCFLNAGVCVSVGI